MGVWCFTRWNGFQMIVEKINQASFTNKKVRTFQRLMFSKAVAVTVDKSGRILIPDYLRKIAGLLKQLVFVGVSDRIEIWDQEKWNGYEEENSQAFENIAEDLFDS